MKRKLRYQIQRWRYTLRESLSEWFGKHVPKIPARRPPAPDRRCGSCGEPLDQIMAIDTGDGWAIFWECKNYCGWEEANIEDWWPYLFRAWCKAKDLERVGIEVL
jgi:hypothetical protein